MVDPFHRFKLGAALAALPGQVLLDVNWTLVEVDVDIQLDLLEV